MRSVVIVVAGLLAGCSSTSASIRTRFANERACPEAEVDVAASGGTQYRASGCGQSAVYVCESVTMSASDVRRCVERDAPPGHRAPQRDRPVLPPPDPRIPTP